MPVGPLISYQRTRNSWRKGRGWCDTVSDLLSNAKERKEKRKKGKFGARFHSSGIVRRNLLRAMIGGRRKGRKNVVGFGPSQSFKGGPRGVEHERMEINEEKVVVRRSREGHHLILNTKRLPANQIQQDKLNDLLLTPG